MSDNTSAAKRPVRRMGGHMRGGMPGEKAKDFRGTLIKLLRYIASHRAALITVILFAVGSTIFSILGPKILSQATTEIFTGLMAKSLVIDGVIENINLCKYFTIVCDEPDPICDFIHDALNRSATIFKGEGTYTHQQKFIILTVMKRSQAVQLRNFLKKNDPGAFMMITNSSEIIGKGFRGFN